MKCPFCGYKKTTDVTDSLIEEAASSAKLRHCPNCSGLFGRGT